MIPDQDIKRLDEKLDRLLSVETPELSEQWEEQLMERINTPQVRKNSGKVPYFVLVACVLLINGFAAMSAIPSGKKCQEMSRHEGLRSVSEQFLMAIDPMHKPH